MSRSEFKDGVRATTDRMALDKLRKTPVEIPTCPDCGSLAIERHPAFVYGSQREWFGTLWVCSGFPTCDSYVRSGADGVPLGRLANADLRLAKKLAHRAFDPIYEAFARDFRIDEADARAIGYRWLARKMAIPEAECSMGQFNVAQCEQVVAICAPFRGDPLMADIGGN